MARKQTDPNSEPETLGTKLFGRKPPRYRQSEDELDEITARDRDAIRQYLLRQLPEDQEPAIEERLSKEGDLFEELEIAEDELIDNYLANKLTESDRKKFEQHFLATPERKQQLRFAAAMKRQPSWSAEEEVGWFDLLKKWLRQNFFTTPLLVPASVLIVAGIAWFVVVEFRKSDVDDSLTALNAAYSQQRPLEARITELNYAPFVTTRGQSPNNVNEAERQRAELTLLEALRKNPTPAVHHALGKVYLTKNDFTSAIEQFEEALKGDPRNVQIYADLGAAYLEKGKVELEPAPANQPSPGGKALEDLSRSLENLDKALELDPNFLAALFNRALCLEYQSLPVRAEEEWRAYLRKDSNSPWAEEARRHLQALEKQKGVSETKESPLQDFLRVSAIRDEEAAWLTLRQHRDVSGGPIENALIDDYLQSVTSGQREKSIEALNVLSYAGELERTRAGDLFVSDMVGFLRSMSEAQRQSLVAARALMKAGRENLVQSKPEAAVRNYTGARETLLQIGATGAALYAEYPLGHAYLLATKSEPGRDIFKRVAEQCEGRHYQWLLAQALNATANAELGLTNYSAALEASHRSLELSKQIGDITGVIKTTSQLAQQYYTLGNYSKSLDLHEQSLALAKVAVLEPMQVWRNYFYIGLPLSAMGLHSAAIEYEKEGLRRAEEMNAPHAICRSYTILGLMYAGRRDFDTAIKEVGIALEQGQKIPSDAAQKESIAYSSLQLGHLYRQAGDFNKSIDNYDHAMQLYGELENYQAFSYLAHKGKLLSCIRQQGCPSVAAEIQTCLDLFENYRLKILELSNRESFFDREQTIYDIAIGYEFSRGNFQAAFEYSERARSRSLIDSTSTETTMVGGHEDPDMKFGSTTAAPSFDQIKARVPPQTQIVQYAVLEDKLLLWLLSDTDFVAEVKVISLDDLNEQLLPYLKLVSSPAEGNGEELTRRATALYDLLIKPIESSLRKDKLLCIVPDKSLNYLAFGALVSARSGKFLVDEYKLVSASSSTMFIRSSDLARQKTESGEKRSGSEMLLAVGNPRFSRKGFPLLPDLPAAAKEVDEIKNYYGKSARVLVGAAATKQAVKAEMRRSNVVHLAMHSIVDEDSPLRSRLIFASGERREPANEDDGILSAYEVHGLNLPRAHLVILSACETGIGRYYRGEGMMGLSTTFIGAGVPLVVASLWRVDSDSTGDLMIAFHRYRKTENLSSAEALQKAQQAMANGADRRYRNPYYWAGFTLVGGSATF